MKENLFRSHPGSAFRRLRGCSVNDSKTRASSCRCCSGDSKDSCKKITSEVIVQSLALAGLEHAVKATYQSSTSINRVGALFDEVKAANVFASEAQVRDVEELIELADIYPLSHYGDPKKTRSSRPEGQGFASRIPRQ